VREEAQRPPARRALLAHLRAEPPRVQPVCVCVCVCVGAWVGGWVMVVDTRSLEHLRVAQCTAAAVTAADACVWSRPAGARNADQRDPTSAS
jgi:hypothetical protein